jgi:phytoene dehydrogenase-like protein
VPVAGEGCPGARRDRSRESARSTALAGVGDCLGEPGHGAGEHGVSAGELGVEVCRRLLERRSGMHARPHPGFVFGRARSRTVVAIVLSGWIGWWGWTGLGGVAPLGDLERTELALGLETGARSFLLGASGCLRLELRRSRQLDRLLAGHSAEVGEPGSAAPGSTEVPAGPLGNPGTGKGHSLGRRPALSGGMGRSRALACLGLGGWRCGLWLLGGLALAAARGWWEIRRRPRCCARSGGVASRTEDLHAARASAISRGGLRLAWVIPIGARFVDPQRPLEALDALGVVGPSAQSRDCGRQPDDHPEPDDDRQGRHERRSTSSGTEAVALIIAVADSSGRVARFRPRPGGRISVEPEARARLGARPVRRKPTVAHPDHCARWRSAWLRDPELGLGLPDARSGDDDAGVADAEVVVVGAGLAGLAAALRVAAAGRSVLVLEAEAQPGGRVRSFDVDGFILDRGFQVLPVAYPELHRVVDLDHLELGRFGLGVEVRLEGRALPLELSLSGWRGLGALVGAGLVRPGDLIGLGRLVAGLLRSGGASDEGIGDETTEAWLRAQPLSEAMIERLWRPFLGGVTLDRSLHASARSARSALRALLRGGGALPKGGAARVTRHLASRLPQGSLRLGAKARAVRGRLVELEEGGTLTAELGVVVATEGPEASRLLGGRVADPGSRSVRCLYFRSESPVVSHRLVMVDGEGRGPATNAAQVTNVVPSLAPAGWSLLAMAVPGPLDRPGDRELLEAARAQLRGWFGAKAASLELVDLVRVPHGQPAQLSPVREPVEVEPGLYCAGDYLEEASVNGALASGRRAAVRLLDAVDPRPSRRAS